MNEQSDVFEYFVIIIKDIDGGAIEEAEQEAGSQDE